MHLPILLKESIFLKISFWRVLSVNEIVFRNNDPFSSFPTGILHSPHAWRHMIVSATIVDRPETGVDVRSPPFNTIISYQMPKNAFSVFYIPFSPLFRKIMHEI